MHAKHSCKTPPNPGHLKVVIVGAGVSGLQTARAFLRTGMRVTVMEMGVDVGGVWYKNYAGFGLQVPWYLYQFPEYPFPEHIHHEEYPSGQTVQKYIQSYAKHFGIYEHIRFCCKLLRLQRSRKTGWNVFYCDGNQGNQICRMDADFVVMCTGIFSKPFTPPYTGLANFRGMHCHAQSLQDREPARGRNVVVVGAGKTALDCAAEVAVSEVAKSVTLLYRQPHWPMPRCLGDKVQVKHIMHSRLPSLMLPPYYQSAMTERLVRSAAKPFQWCYWRLLEGVIKRQFRMQKDQVPSLHLDKDLFYGGQILDSSWHALVASGRVTPQQGEIEHFEADGLVLQSGVKLEADLVVFCTGYHKTYEYLDPPEKSALKLQADGLYLYRNILPPGVPGLAFVGAEVSTLNNILTHRLQAEWLTAVLLGKLKLPRIEDMQTDIIKQQTWRRSVMPHQRYRGSVVALYQTDYHEQLLGDMSVPAPPPQNGLFSCWSPFYACDYDVVLAANQPSEAIMISDNGVPCETEANEQKNPTVAMSIPRPQKSAPQPCAAGTRANETGLTPYRHNPSVPGPKTGLDGPDFRPPALAACKKLAKRRSFKFASSQRSSTEQEMSSEQLAQEYRSEYSPGKGNKPNMLKWHTLKRNSGTKGRKEGDAGSKVAAVKSGAQDWSEPGVEEADEEEVNLQCTGRVQSWMDAGGHHVRTVG